jgi:hypothetical protein
MVSAHIACYHLVKEVRAIVDCITKTNPNIKPPHKHSSKIKLIQFIQKYCIKNFAATSGEEKVASRVPIDQHSSNVGVDHSHTHQKDRKVPDLETWMQHCHIHPQRRQSLSLQERARFLAENLKGSRLEQWLHRVGVYTSDKQPTPLHVTNPNHVQVGPHTEATATSMPAPYGTTAVIIPSTLSNNESYQNDTKAAVGVNAESYPRWSAQERMLLMHARIWGFDNHVETLQAIRTWRHTHSGEYPSEDDLMWALLQEWDRKPRALHRAPEFLEASNGTDQPEVKEEMLLQPHVQELAPGLLENTGPVGYEGRNETLLQASIDTWLLQDQFFPCSWLLRSNSFGTLRQWAFANRQVKGLLIQLFDWEKKAQLEYPVDVPRAYFSIVVQDRCMEITSALDMEAQLEREIDILEVAMNHVPRK